MMKKKSKLRHGAMDMMIKMKNKKIKMMLGMMMNMILIRLKCKNLLRLNIAKIMLNKSRLEAL